MESKSKRKTPKCPKEKADGLIVQEVLRLEEQESEDDIGEIKIKDVFSVIQGMNQKLAQHIKENSSKISELTEAVNGHTEVLQSPHKKHRAQNLHGNGGGEG